MSNRSTRLIFPHENRLIPDALDEFVLSLRASQRSERTIEFYVENIGRFVWWLRKQGESLEVSAINPSHVRSFTAYLQTHDKRWGKKDNPAANKPLSDSSIQAYFRSLRAFFNFCQSEELITESPFRDQRLKAPKVRDKVLPTYSTGEIRALLKACGESGYDHLRDTAIILLLLDTGIRATELCTLEMASLEPGRVKVLGKGNKERYVIISAVTEKAIRDYVRKERELGGDLLFLGIGTKGLTYAGLREIMRRRGRQAGVENASLHKFRRYFALEWLKLGGPLNALVSLLGHSSPVMSMHYAAMVTEGTQALHRQFSPVDSLMRAPEKKKR